MKSTPESNHGEGDPVSGKRFNDAETRFVGSAQGKKKIRDGAKVRPEEETGLAKAEELGKARAKGLDSKDSTIPVPKR